MTTLTINHSTHRSSILVDLSVVFAIIAILIAPIFTTVLTPCEALRQQS